MALDFLAEHFAASALPLLRTDTADDAGWAVVLEQVRASAGKHESTVVVVDDASVVGLTAATLAERWGRGREQRGFVLLADARSAREAAEGDDATLVLVDLSVTPEDEAEFGDVFGESFRCAASSVGDLEVNIRLGNFDFADMAAEADEHG